MLIVERVYEEGQSDLTLAGSFPLHAEAQSHLFLVSERLRSNRLNLVDLTDMVYL